MKPDLELKIKNIVARAIETSGIYEDQAGVVGAMQFITHEVTHKTADLFRNEFKDVNVQPDYGQFQLPETNRILDDQDYKLAIVENMRTYGGSFVKALAECVVRADRTNLNNLLFSFPDYFGQYLPEKWSRK